MSVLNKRSFEPFCVWVLELKLSVHYSSCGAARANSSYFIGALSFSVSLSVSVPVCLSLCQSLVSSNAILGMITLS